MAKDEEMVTISAAVLKEIQTRMEVLEQAQRINTELLVNSKARILDPDYEMWKMEASRSAQERSQSIVEQKFGVKGKLYRCKLDSTQDDGKPGPKIDEHPVLIIPGNSEYEAQGRYLEIIGVRKHDYKVKTELVSAA